MTTARAFASATAFRVVILGASVIGFGCAGYSIEENGAGPGYDVYAPEPYLLRQPAFGGGAVTGFRFELVWLPNASKRYRVNSWSGLGRADFAFSFEDGWKLVSIEDRGDNTAALGQLVELAKHAIPAASARDLASEPGAEGPDVAAVPVLYRIEFEDGRVAALRQVPISSGNPVR